MNQNDNDADIRLRDQLAMSVVAILIDRFHQRKAGEGSWFDEGKVTEQFKDVAKMVSIMAYCVADEMRKARLQSFT